MTALATQDTPANTEEYLPAEEETTDSTPWVVVCLGSLSVHVNGQPFFGCKVYGPFPEEDLPGVQREIQKIEGGAILVRPLVDLDDTYRRLSAD